MIRQPSRRWLVPLLAFLVPALAVLAAAVWLGVSPFGGKTLLTLDLRQQYVQFYAWFRRCLLEGESLFYSPAKGFGGGTFGLVAYYLLSPLNLILLLFPGSRLPEAVLAISVIKVGLCGLTMSRFLDLRGGEGDGAVTLALSWCYALMAYVVVFLSNLMWLDAVILLPLIALGITRLVREGKPFLYLLSLAGGIWCNAYIGISLCLFSVLYFLHQWIVLRPAKPLRRVGLFLLSSLLAGALCGVVLVPLALSLSDGKAAFASPFAQFRLLFDGATFAGRLLTSRVEYTDYTAGLPNLFAGLLALLGALLALGRRGIPLREKLASLGLLLVLGLSMALHSLNLIWHGLNPPVWFSFRYSFLFSFVLLALADRGLNVQRKSPCNKALAAALLGCLALLAYAWAGGGLSGRTFALLVAGLLCLVSLPLWGWPLPRRLLSVALLCCCLVDLGVNVYLPLRVGKFEDRTEFESAYNQWNALREVGESRTGDFFRAEILGNLGVNDALFANQPSLSHYSSIEEGFVVRFLRQMGIGTTGPSVRYVDGTSLPADSFLGVRYLAAAGPAPNVESFAPVGEAEGLIVYENPYTLPLAYAADPALLDLTGEDTDRVGWQNRLWGAALGVEDLPLLLPQEARLEATGFTASPGQEGMLLYQADGDEEGTPSLSYRVTVDRDGPVYAYLYSGYQAQTECALTLNGQPFGTYFASHGYGALSLGTFAAGEEILLTLTPDGPALLLGGAYFYSLDLAVLRQSVESLRQGAFEVTQSSNTHLTLSGETTREGQILLVTLPASEGWRATVDGRPAQIQRAAHALIALPLSPGRHEVRLDFVPPGLLPGLLITGGALLGCLALALFLRRRKIRLDEPR